MIKMIGNSIMILVLFFLTALPIQAQEIKSTELSRHFQTHSLPLEANVGPECKKQVKTFLNDLNDLELWALQMFDSTGKLNAGLLGGNVAHFGDYEQCLSVSHNDIKGKYCLSTLFVDARNSAPDSVKEAVDRLLSRRIITSTANDNIKIVPSFTELYWGLCVPSGCSETDVGAMVSTLLSPYNTTETGLKFDLKMEPKPCDTKDDNHSYYNQVLFLILFGTVLWLVSHSTIVDIINGYNSQATQNSKPEMMWNKMFMAFSLKRTVPFLLDTSDPGELKCIHGLRFYFSLLIYLLHKAVFLMFVPVINRISVAELMENEASMIIRVVWNCVDTFVLISGLLTSYFTIKKLKNGGRMNILHMYIQRYIKFTPVFLMTLLSFTFFAKRLSSGPLMISVGNHFLDGCENIWKSVFYVSNFDGINNMCYPPAHQLITDFQMYLMSPIFIYALFKWKNLGVAGCAATLVLLTLYKGAVVYYYKYSTLLFYGISVSMIGDGGNDIYLNPIHRLTPYLIGVMFGYFLQEMKPQHKKLSWEKLAIGWSACMLCFYYAYFAMAKAAKRNYQYSETEAALFGMAQPLLWCPAICWIIYTCQTGQAGLVSKMLEWRGFVIFSRLSYPFYLVQIMIIFWSVTDVKAPQQRSLFYFIDLNEFAGLIFLSAIFSLFFLLPLKDLFNSVKGAKNVKSVKIMDEFQSVEKNKHAEEENRTEENVEVNGKRSTVKGQNDEKFDFTNIIERAVPKNETFKL